MSLCFVWLVFWNVFIPHSYSVHIMSVSRILPEEETCSIITPWKDGRISLFLGISGSRLKFPNMYFSVLIIFLKYFTMTLIIATDISNNALTKHERKIKPYQKEKIYSILRMKISFFTLKIFRERAREREGGRSKITRLFCLCCYFHLI